VALKWQERRALRGNARIAVRVIEEPCETGNRQGFRRKRKAGGESRQGHRLRETAPEKRTRRNHVSARRCKEYTEKKKRKKEKKKIG